MRLLFVVVTSLTTGLIKKRLVTYNQDYHNNSSKAQIRIRFLETDDMNEKNKYEVK